MMKHPNICDLSTIQVIVQVVQQPAVLKPVVHFLHYRKIQVSSVPLFVHVYDIQREHVAEIVAALHQVLLPIRESDIVKYMIYFWPRYEIRGHGYTPEWMSLCGIPNNSFASRLLFEFIHCAKDVSTTMNGQLQAQSEFTASEFFAGKVTTVHKINKWDKKREVGDGAEDERGATNQPAPPDLERRPTTNTDRHMSR
ncbi:hypothetical protein P154DRAFT_563248 [Amniculicola lignicola CBS 123094]|uniref:Uncharacterized protein n=1 Tax=Amniculicola lignicola CBS 123094 TaxID=1392246 RepID=A0A6A5WF23_9PLEO|nr:hypothetical protein P154DRAFT_563248 [Amniculicola lignicola CBS 123094]